MRFLDQLKKRSTMLKRNTLAIWYAAKDNRTPWYVKALAGLVAAYAFSPVDLIPDFVPVFGYLDDLILIPAGIALIVKLLPAEVLHQARAKADTTIQKPVSWIAGVIIVLLWSIVIFFIGRAIFRLILKTS